MKTPGRLLLLLTVVVCLARADRALLFVAKVHKALVERMEGPNLRR